MSYRQGDMPAEAATEKQPVGDLLERLIAEAEQGQSHTPDILVERLPPESSGGGLPSGGILGGLLSSPALLSALPQLMNGLGGLSKGTVSAESTEEKDGNGGGSAAVSAKQSGYSHPDRHTALLCALKPYLGSERQQAAEYLISLCRVWSTLQGMGINLPALLLSGQGGAPQQRDKEV